MSKANPMPVRLVLGVCPPQSPGAGAWRSKAAKLLDGKRGDRADGLVDSRLARGPFVRLGEHGHGVASPIGIRDDANLVANLAHQTPALRLHVDAAGEADGEAIAGLLTHQAPHFGAGGGR